MSEGESRLSWRRVFDASVVIALIGAAFVLVPMAWQYQQRISEHVRALPRPVPADAATQAAILTELVRKGEIKVFELPPDPKASVAAHLPALVDTTVPLCADDAASGVPDCDMYESGGIVPLDPNEPLGMPLKLRQELVLANRMPRRLVDPRIRGLHMITRAQADARYEAGGFFYGSQRAEDDPGYVEVSVAVLSPDRREAMIVIASGCGRDCRVMGKLYRLARHEASWRVTDESLAWAHIY